MFFFPKIGIICLLITLIVYRFCKTNIIIVIYTHYDLTIFNACFFKTHLYPTVSAQLHQMRAKAERWTSCVPRIVYIKKDKVLRSCLNFIEKYSYHCEAGFGFFESIFGIFSFLSFGNSPLFPAR